MSFVYQKFLQKSSYHKTYQLLIISHLRIPTSSVVRLVLSLFLLSWNVHIKFSLDILKTPLVSSCPENPRLLFSLEPNWKIFDENFWKSAIDFLQVMSLARWEIFSLNPDSVHRWTCPKTVQILDKSRKVEKSHSIFAWAKFEFQLKTFWNLADGFSPRLNIRLENFSKIADGVHVWTCPSHVQILDMSWRVWKSNFKFCIGVSEEIFEEQLLRLMKNFLQDFRCADKISQEFMLMFSLGHVHHMFNSWTCPEKFEKAITKISSANLRNPEEQHFVIDQKFSSKLIIGFQNFSKILDEILIRTSPEYVHCWTCHENFWEWNLKFLIQWFWKILKKNFWVCWKIFSKIQHSLGGFLEETFWCWCLDMSCKGSALGHVQKSWELKIQFLLWRVWRNLILKTTEFVNENFFRQKFPLAATPISQNFSSEIGVAIWRKFLQECRWHFYENSQKSSK